MSRKKSTEKPLDSKYSKERKAELLTINSDISSSEVSDSDKCYEEKTLLTEGSEDHTEDVKAIQKIDKEKKEYNEEVSDNESSENYNTKHDELFYKSKEKYTRKYSESEQHESLREESSFNENSNEERKSVRSKERSQGKKLTCDICYEGIKVQGTIESCTHQFCFSCIKRWSEVIFL